MREIDEMTNTGTEPQAFAHADGIPNQPGAPLSSTTRYLSGAAYIDQKYAEKVIDEMVGESHRAVAPALGYDLVTIIRHCFRAQRLWLRQNALLTLALVAGAVLLPGPTVTLFVICLGAYMFVPDRGRARPGKGRPVWQVVVALVVVLAVGGCLFGPVRSLLATMGPGSFSTTDIGSTYGTATNGDSSDGVVKFVLGLLALVAGLMTVLTVHRYRMIDIITADLARGQAGPVLRPEAREVEHRLGVIESAQSGNIVLHAGFEPFVGAGDRINAWAVATELRARPEDAEPGAAPGPRVDLDPNELMHHLRYRLASMRARDLPGPSRIVGLQLRDQVVSSGTRWHDYPLIDERTRLPYSYAEQATVEAIIRSPQTSARHFLRISVGAPDRAALGADGRTIMPAEHQSVISSTFIHVAVEGGLLYVELVSTVLGPIRQTYLDIDRYSATEDRLGPAVAEAFRRFLGDVAVAPFRLVHALYRRFTLIGSMHKADREAAAEPVYDFGARLDVRELASRSTYANYLQGLDAEKYTRLIDKRVTEAIDEYLVANGIDSTDFVAKANFYQYNNSAVVAGDVNGSIAVGMGAKASQSGATITTGKAPGSAK